MSEYVTLEEFVAVDEPGAEPLAASSDGGSVIPAGGLVVFYGGGGAGKTTALVDAMMHLAAGIPWLGLVKPTRPLTVVWIENEGPRPEFRKKLGAKLAAWLGGSTHNRIRHGSRLASRSRRSTRTTRLQASMPARRGVGGSCPRRSTSCRTLLQDGRSSTVARRTPSHRVPRCPAM